MLRILHLEDDPLDTEKVLRLLTKAGLPARIDRVITLEDFQGALGHEDYALIFSDYTVPGVEPLEAIKLARHMRPDLPIIFVSGTIGEDVAIETLKLGATDYVLKQRLERLVPAVRRALAEADAQARRRQAEQALRASEARYRALIHASSQVIYRMSPDWSEMCLLHGGGFLADMEQTSRDWLQEYIHPDDQVFVLEAIGKAVSSGDIFELEHRVRRKDGTVGWTQSRAVPLRNDDGEIIEWFGAATDITERKRAEEAQRQADERLRRAITIQTVGIIFFRTDGSITDANDAFLRMSGYSREDLEKGLVRRDVMTPPEFMPASLKAVEEFKTAQQTVPYEKQYVRKDGSRWWGLFAAVRIDEDEGVEFITDISEQKRVQQALKDSERRLSDIIECLPDATFALDQEGRIIAWNKAVEELTGAPAVDVLGKGNHEYTYRLYGERIPCLADELLRGDQPAWSYSNLLREEDFIKAEVFISHLKPGGVWISIKVAPIYDAQGNIIGVIESCRDITDRKQAEEALREANEQLRAADRRKDEFLAMLAHELRNPLAPIRYAVQMLNMNGLPENQLQKQRDIIDRQISHMGRLLDDLLEVSRITRGKIELKCEIVDLRTVARQAIDSLRPMIDGRGQHFLYEAPNSPLPVDGDPIRLEQIIRNLLHNANKYTEAGGCIKLSLTLETDHETVWRAAMRVSDSGIGIAPEMLPIVFEAFVQAEQGLARTQGGLGIGLAMVKNLVQMHGGSVEAHSAGVGRGSEFVVRLPLAAEMMGDLTSVSAPAKPPQAAPSRPRRVLVVDDNEDSAASLGELLSLWGHEIQTAHDGRHALAAAQGWQPEIILLDIGLPGMDGYEVAHRLREDPTTAGSFLVALTGYGQEEDRRRAHEAGFNRHLTKPVELEQLQNLLQEAQAA